jgi:phage baseplate assembly protein W
MPYKNIVIDIPNYSPTLNQGREHLYKGFSTIDSANTSAKLYDFDLIKQDILNHFNTKKGERVMNPEFGTIIWDLIFEPLTEQVREFLTTDITTICSFDPRAAPTEIKINEYDQGYIIEITLLMKSTNETSTMRLAFDQNIGLRVQ